MKKHTKTQRKIVISDDTAGNKLKAVMYEKGLLGWKSKKEWKLLSTDREYVMYVVQSWNNTEDYDILIVNQSEKVSIDHTDGVLIFKNLTK